MWVDLLVLRRTDKEAKSNIKACVILTKSGVGGAWVKIVARIIHDRLFKMGKAGAGNVCYSVPFASLYRLES